MKLWSKFTSSSLLLVLFLVFSSCNKEKSYPFQIINNSNYDIQLMSFHGTFSGDDLTLNAGDTSSVILLSYKQRFRLYQKMICLTINDYVDTSGAFNVVYSPCLPLKTSELNGDLNTLSLTNTAVSDTLTFELTLML